jgi:uncharacterized protein (DUF697 family)
VATPGLGDFSSIWKTVSEVDVGAVRREAERRVAVACIGHPVALFEVDRLLRRGPTRYPLGPTPLVHVALEQAPQRLAELGRSALLIVALDSRLRLTAEEEAALAQLAATAQPLLVVLLFARPLPEVAGAASATLEDGAVRLIDPLAPEAAERLADAVLGRLPAALHLAAARRLPGLRAPLARRLTQSVCLTNATVALASGLPELVPIIGLPLTAADAMVLTKNQVLLVFRLALAYGAPPEFRKRMLEIAPVIGAGLAWRELARTLAGFIPVWGLVPKVTIAYAGTFIAGVAAARWYETGFVSRAELRRISDEARTIAREAATQLVEEARAAGGLAGRGSRAGLQAVAHGAKAAGAKAASGVRRVTGRRRAAPRPSPDATSGAAPPQHRGAARHGPAQPPVRQCSHLRRLPACDETTLCASLAPIGTSSSRWAFVSCRSSVRSPAMRRQTGAMSMYWSTTCRGPR